MKNTSLISRCTNHRRLHALVAVGGSLAALPAGAIELGDLTVHSNLGQPLRASIAYALAPTEQLFGDCISLRPGATASGLPNVGRATISVANGVIKLTGNTAIREPMVAAHLRVSCPYSANISREYMLFVDPQVVTYEQAEVVVQPVMPVAKAAVAPAPSRPAARRPVTVQKDIKAAQRYQVRPGESVSLIAQRIENRGVGLWAAVDAIFAANPEAFIDDDPNKLKAGAWLVVPNFGSGEPIVTENTFPVVADGADSTAGNVAIVLDEIVAEAVVEPSATEVVIIPDTELAAPESTSTSPNVVTAAATTKTVATVATRDSGSSSWWLWLAGGGVAIALALILFGRRSRTRPAAFAAVASNENLGRRSTDTTDTEQLAAVSVDYDLINELPTTEDTILDADLILGTGLNNGTDMDGSTPDIELPTVAADHPILEHEIMPVDDHNETMITDSYTINREVNFEVLEQEYEDEMTATQALNEEITRAATELASLTNDDENAAPGDETAVLHLASVTELDVTSHLPSQQQTIGDDEDTGINEILTEKLSIEDNTIEMPAAENDEKTVEMPVKTG